MPKEYLPYFYILYKIDSSMNNMYVLFFPVYYKNEYRFCRLNIAGQNLRNFPIFSWKNSSAYIFKCTNFAEFANIAKMFRDLFSNYCSSIMKEVIFWIDCPKFRISNFHLIASERIFNSSHLTPVVFFAPSVVQWPLIAI